jgi:ferredoxin
MDMLRKVLLTVLFTCVLTSGFSKVSKQTADSIAGLLNQKEVVCDKACPLFESEKSNAGLVNTIFIDVLAIIGTVWLYSNYKKKYFFVAGAVLVVIVTGSLLLKSNSNQCVEYAQSSCKIIAGGKGNTTAQSGGLGDFQQMDSSVVDSSSVDSSTSSSSEFSNLDVPGIKVVSQPAASVDMTSAKILDPMIAFVLMALIGLGMKYRTFVRFRGLFLLIGVGWFGFYRGGCTCMISSFQSLILGIARWQFAWIDLIWLAALVVATYFFGRVWCGWLCHLGAVQDFLYRSPKLKILTSVKSQRYIRIVRYLVFTLWILQLLVMRRNLYCAYDPFKSLFNMIFTDTTSIVLLLLLLVSSVLIYRPFCRLMCPVGVILGFVSKIPGARRMKTNAGCVSCGLCSKECAMHAVSKHPDKTSVNPEDCIACGDCITVCRKGGIKLNVK